MAGDETSTREATLAAAGGLRERPLSRATRVLIVTHLYPSSLSASRGSFIQAEVEGLADAGIDVILVTPVPFVPPLAARASRRWREMASFPPVTGTSPLLRLWPRVPTPPRQILWGWSGVSTDLWTRRPLRRLHEERPFDLVHGHTLVPGGEVALRSGRRLRIPVVVTSHGSDAQTSPFTMRGYRRHARRVVRSADALVTPSAALAVQLARLGPSRRGVHVVPYGVDAPPAGGQDARTRARRALGVPSKATLVVFVGAVHRSKGIFELLDAMAPLVAHHPSLQLGIVGDGLDVAHVVAAVSRPPLAGRVHLAGHVPRELVRTWLDASDVFTLPSHAEGLPNAVLEALAAGRPVVATNVGGIPEAVQEGVTGRLVPPRDVDALRSAVEDLVLHEDERSRMGAAAATSAGRFRWDSHVRHILDIYGSVL